MAPRAPESKAEVIARVRAAAAMPVAFGSPHHTHAVVAEDGRWRVRRLHLPEGKAEAYLKEHGIFMPEHAEDLSEPTGDIVLEAPTQEALLALLQSARWPL